MIDRWLQASFAEDLRKPFVHILFGARQTGKSTLLSHLLPAPSLHYNLADPEERSRLLADAGAFRRECEALPARTEPHVVFVDEAQAVPAVFDAVQVLYDRNRFRWKFVLCGSSARKLRQTGANLLPGRSMLHRLFPLILAERPATTDAPANSFVLPIPATGAGSTFSVCRCRRSSPTISSWRTCSSVSAFLLLGQRAQGAAVDAALRSVRPRHPARCQRRPPRPRRGARRPRTLLRAVGGAGAVETAPVPGGGPSLLLPNPRRGGDRCRGGATGRRPCTGGGKVDAAARPRRRAARGSVRVRTGSRNGGFRGVPLSAPDAVDAERHGDPLVRSVRAVPSDSAAAGPSSRNTRSAFVRHVADEHRRHERARH